MQITQEQSSAKVRREKHPSRKARLSFNIGLAIYISSDA
jgi:hypothetical protein